MGDILEGIAICQIADVRQSYPRQRLSERKVTATVDYAEVFRAAHQLAKDRGRNAHVHAAKLAEQAAKEAKERDAAFWNAVAAALTPR